jgi:alpha-tubulin suppressor-like RCC1 family protein
VSADIQRCALKLRILHVAATSVATSLFAVAFFVVSHLSTARAQQLTGSTVAVWGFSGNNEISPLTGYVRNPLLVRFADNSVLSDIVAVSQGQSHTIALSSDGTVWAWGLNQYGQLGDGTTMGRPYPAQVRLANGSALTNIVAIAAGDLHTLALRSDGTVWSWGYNWFGQVGDGTNLNVRINPIQVALAQGGMLSNVVAVAAGESHSVALRGDGTVWVWGRGNGAPPGAPQFDTFTRPTVPVRLADGMTLTGVVNVAAGSNHTMALRNDGSLWTWGSNVSGQLGDGTTTNRTFAAPVGLADGRTLTGIVAVDGAHDHSIVLRADGSVLTFGLNDVGQLGDGTRVNSPFPVTVRLADGTALSGATAVSAGGRANVAVRADGSMWAWGDDNAAQLGDGGVSGFRATAARVLLPDGGFATARAASVGGSAVASIGSFVPIASVAPAGLDFGSVPEGLTSAPQSITVTNTGTSDLSISNVSPGLNFYYKTTAQTTCAAGTILAPGAQCRVEIVFEPASVGTFGSAVTIETNASGSPHVVSLTAVSVDPIQIDVPSTIDAVEGVVTSIAGRVNIAGAHQLVELVADLDYDGMFDEQPAVLTADNSFRFDYTYPDNGRLVVQVRARDELNRIFTRFVTVIVSNVAPSVDPIPNQTAFVGSFFRIAGTFTDPGADTWTARIDYGDGRSDSLVIGPGRSFQTQEPPHQYATQGVYTASITVVDDEGATGTQTFTVSAERFQTTTLLFESAASPTSRLGEVVQLNFFVNGTTGSSAVTFLDGDTILGSVPLDGANSGAIVVGTLRPGTHNLTARYEGSVRSAPSTSAVVTHVVTAAGGALRAWGSGVDGQLGDGTFASRNAPAAVQGLTGDVVAVAGGWAHSVALKADGTVWAWGLNSNSQLGIGDTSIVRAGTPVQVADLSDVVSIAVGSQHAIALKADGTVWVWGYNGAGQLGTGTHVNESRPRMLNLPAVAAIAAGGSHSVALLIDRSVMTWGDNTFGQLGVGVDRAALPSSPTPMTIDPSYLPQQITAVAAGGDHTLALNSTQVMAWGYNQQGQVGDGSFTNRLRPVLVPALANETSVAIAAGGTHSLALLTDGTVRTWGANSWGQLGNNSFAHSSSPVSTPLTNVVAIAGGLYHSAAVLSDGTLWSWGRDTEGELGDGPTVGGSLVPTLTTTKVIGGGAGVWAGFAIGSITTGDAQPATLSFAAQRAGTTSASQSVTITNTGSMPLSVRPNVIGGSRDFVVSRDECSGVDVTPGSGCSLDIVFAPTALPPAAGSIQSRSALIWLAANIPSPLSVSLTGIAFSDDTPPAVSLRTPTDATYTLDESVMADYSCSDASGVAACDGTVPNGAPIDMATPGLHTFTVTARDTFGNTSTSSVSYTVIALPTISIVAPMATIYDRGSVVIAQYTCQNAVTCAGDVPSGSALETSEPGLKSFVVSATDAMGNITTEIVTYSVSLGACVQPIAGLTAWLPGDGSAVDRISETSAIWTGAETYAAGNAAQGFSTLNGSSVSLPFEQVGPFTLQAWVRTPRRLDPEFTGVLSTGGPGQNATSLQLELDGTGNYRLNVGDTDVALIGPALDAFQHVAVTFDGSIVTVYLNGQLVQSDVWTGSQGLGFHVLNLGIDRDGTHPFTGTIDEVQVFNRALTDTEVAQTFLAGSAGFCKNHLPVAVATALPNPAEASGSPGASVTLDASASSDPDGDALTFTWTEGSTTLSTEKVAAVSFPIGTHTVTLTASDGVASATTTISVVVQDTTPSVLTVPSSVVEEATSAAGAIVTFTASATDLVDGSTTVTCSQASGSIFPLGTTSVRCTSTDAHGNRAEALFDVTVKDTTPPSVTLPADITAEATDATGRIVTFTATATDIVDGPVPVTCSPPSGSLFGLGTTTVRCFAIDVAGNGGAFPFTITVVDTRGPELFLPHDMIGEAAGPLGTIVNYVAGASDAVTGPAPVTCSPDSGSAFPIGTTPVSCTAADATGHQTTGTFRITVVDTTAPATLVITSPSTDAFFSTPTADVIVQTSDLVGVTAVNVNGVPGGLTTGTVQLGTWRATVPLALPVALGGALRFDVTVSDLAGNIRAASLLLDNDGIPQAMDRDRASGADQSNVFSNDFNNNVTAATIARAGWTATFSNAPSAGGVRATISGSGVGPAVISACVGLKKDVRLDVVGETADITCNPATGTVTVRAVSAVSTIQLREQLTNGFWQQFILRTGQRVSVGSPATAAADNTETIDAQILQIDANGVETVVGAYQLAPGSSVDVSATSDAAGVVNVTFEVLGGTVTATVGGETRTIDQGTQLTLPVTGPMKTPSIVTWSAPASIVYGTALGAAQLNAAADVAGTFTYTPAAGTVLSAGSGQTLSVTLTPTDASYTSATARVPITVVQATPTITWKAPASIVAGTPLGAAQLNATASAPGTFVYTPAIGTVLPAGAAQTLLVEFTATDSVNYTKATATVSITVLATFSVSDVSSAEGNSTGATKQALVPVKLATKSTEWIAVSYTTSDGTAKKDADYFTTSDTVWFAPGVVSQSVAIPIVQDTIGEATEAFFVDFTAVINGVPSQARATITILSDDSSTQVFTSSADFAAGSFSDGAYLSETDDGEIMLTPQGAEFFGTSLPSGWTAALLSPDASIAVANGKLAVSGASVASPVETASGQTLEFSAIFSLSPDQRVGFGTSRGDGSPTATFIVRSDGELYARSVNGAKVVESLMAGIDWLGKSHRYKIVWTTGGAQYYVDNTLMITHSSMAWGSSIMRPAIVDSTGGDGALVVDWLRATPYAASGSYTSAVFDTGAAVLWQKLTATSSAPTGTTMTLTYRTGDTPVPDGSWTSFTAAGTGGALVGSSRYVQFAIQLNSTAVAKTPTIQNVTVQFKR